MKATELIKFVEKDGNIKGNIAQEVIDYFASKWKRPGTGPGGKPIEGDIFYSDIYNILKGKYGRKSVPTDVYQQVVDGLTSKGFYIHS